MKIYLRRLLLVIAAVSCTIFLWQTFQGASGEESYEDVAAMAFGSSAPAQEAVEETIPEEKPKDGWIPAPVEEDDPNIDYLKTIDMEALRAVNPDVVGWILIPDTKISYPLMQGTDNDFYLEHTWEKEKNAVGSIFLEHRNSPALTDFNTIIYGHNMTNDSMFGELSHYNNKGFFEKHPYVYLVSDKGVYRYDVFAYYKAPVDGFTYGLSFNETATKVNFVMQAKKKSVMETGVDPAATDRMLTLSTCSGAGYTYRWVVHARLKMVEAE